MALDVTDKTANGNNLTNVNTAVEYTASLPYAQSKTAADFERGSLQYLSITNAAQTGLNFTGDMTMELWVKWETLATDGQGTMFIQKYGGAGNRSYGFAWYLTGGQHKMRFYYSDDGTNVTAHSVDVSAPSTGTWYHYAMSFDASAHATEFFINGSSVGTDSTGTRTSIYNSSADITILYGTIVTDYPDMQVDDIRLWNVTKSATDINTSKSVNLTGAESGLVAYYPFETLTTAITGGNSIFFSTGGMGLA